MAARRVEVLGDYKNQGWVTSPTPNQALWAQIKKPQSNPTAPALTPLIQDTSTGLQAGIQIAPFDVGPEEIITSIVINVYCSTTTGSGPPVQIQSQFGVSGNVVTTTVVDAVPTSFGPGWRSNTVSVVSGLWAPSDISGKGAVAFVTQAANTGTIKVFACYFIVNTIGGQPDIFPRRPSQAVRTAAFR